MGTSETTHPMDSKAFPNAISAVLPSCRRPPASNSHPLFATLAPFSSFASHTPSPWFPSLPILLPPGNTHEAASAFSRSHHTQQVPSYPALPTSNAVPSHCRTPFDGLAFMNCPKQVTQRYRSPMYYYHKSNAPNPLPGMPMNRMGSAVSIGSLTVDSEADTSKYYFHPEIINCTSISLRDLLNYSNCCLKDFAATVESDVSHATAQKITARSVEGLIKLHVGEQVAHKIMETALRHRKESINAARLEATHEVASFERSLANEYAAMKKKIGEDTVASIRELASDEAFQVSIIESTPRESVKRATKAVISSVTTADLKCPESAVKRWGTQRQLVSHHKRHKALPRRSIVMDSLDTLVVEDGRVVARHESCGTRKISHTRHGSYWLLSRQVLVNKKKSSSYDTHSSSNDSDKLDAKLGLTTLERCDTCETPRNLDNVRIFEKHRTAYHTGDLWETKQEESMQQSSSAAKPDK